MSKRDEWFAEWSRRAEQGDAEAQIELAWEYIRGQVVAEDFNKASALFRQAEARKPQLARFNLAKAKLQRRDASLVSDIAGDCEAEYAPALYLMGVAVGAGLVPGDEKQNALHYFARASERGHLVARFFLWRDAKMSLLTRLATLPKGARLIFDVWLAKFRDPDDVRVLM